MGVGRGLINAFLSFGGTPKYQSLWTETKNKKKEKEKKGKKKEISFALAYKN